MKHQTEKEILFWTFIIGLTLIITTTGCSKILKSEMKCSEGVLYIKDNGAWIQALAYKDNKCLPEDVK